MSMLNRPDLQNGQKGQLPIAFPRGFIWGAATAPYQIETATKEDGQSPSIWDQFAATPGKTYQEYTGDVYAHFIHQLRADA